MEQIIIRNPGVSSVEIQIGNRRILVDAFNKLNEPEKVMTGDILLFTHDDGDHFLAQSMPQLNNMDVIIVGPPTIVKPILELKKASLEQIQVLYSNDPLNPASLTINDICIKSFHTQHFNHWDALNNSYLIEVNNKKIYISGDSLVTKELTAPNGKIDVIICNLVDEGYLKCQEDLRFAIHHHLSYLLKISSDCNADKIIGVHLLNFERTVNAEDMMKLIDTYGFDNILIPVSKSQTIVV